MNRLSHLLNVRPFAGLLHVTILIAALVALAASPEAWAAPPAQTPNVLRIGYLGTANSDAAQGALLAIDQINSVGGFQAADGNTYQFELISLANPPSAESLPGSVTAMTAQGVVAILGPDESDLLTPENIGLLVDAGVPVLTGATADTLTDEDATDSLFRIRAPERIYSYALAAYLTGDLGLSSLVLVQTNIESTEALLDFESALSASGIRAAGKVQLADATGLEDQSDAIIALNPEAVVMWGPFEDAAILLGLMQEGGWDGVFAYRSALEAAQSGILPDVLAEGVFGVSSWSHAYPSGASEVFLNDYVTTFGDIPGPLSAAAYDAVWYLRGRLIDAGSDVGALRAGLIAGPALDLVAGTLNPTVFANGDLIHRAVVYELGPGGGPTVVAIFDDETRVTIAVAE